MTPKPRRTVYPVLVLSLLTVAGALAPITASAGPARPQARPAEPQPPVLPRELHGNPPAQPAQPPAPAPGLFDGADAQQTREELRQVLRGYPPSVAQVLRLDPTLAGREDYLSSYPALAAFLAQHAEVAHNPGFFFGQAQFDQPFTAKEQAMRTFETVLGGLGVFLFFTTALGVVAWVVRQVIDHRRWLRATKLHTDAHSKVFDRLSSNEDLLAYVQSPAGRQFLEPTPVLLDSGSRAISAPIGRILWSVQAGVVLAVVGVGVWLVRNSLIEELAGPMSAVAVLAISLGLGFALSALVAYLLSYRLGLLEPLKPQ
jgi:hypothetical protein